MPGRYSLGTKSRKTFLKSSTKWIIGRKRKDILNFSFKPKILHLPIGSKRIILNLQELNIEYGMSVIRLLRCEPEGKGGGPWVAAE